jgi:hypothetical protein
VIRQIESLDGQNVFSTVASLGGFRFVEETKQHEPAGSAHEEYWYWEMTSESGIYSTELEAFEEGSKSISWVQNSN